MRLPWRPAAPLAAIGIPPSRLSPADIAREAFLSVSRAPVRSLLTSLGTVLAVATAIATIGLGDSARGAVSGTFDALRATLVTFSDTDPQAGEPALSADSEQDLLRLNGVREAGLTWSVGKGAVYSVRRIREGTKENSVGLNMMAATPGALAAMDAKVSSGRLYDVGMERRGEQVALLGQAAARQLGITSVDLSPVVYIGDTELRVIGIVDSAPADDQALLSVIIPTRVAVGFSPSGDTRSLLVRTAPGAAQLVGRQGPLQLSPQDPARIAAAVPPDPVQLRNQVDSSVTGLLIAISMVALGVGVLAIANTTLLSVIQRRAEIGLRRSVGAAPRHIAALVVSESAVIGAIGALIGTSLGVLVVGAVSAARGWAPVLDPQVIVGAPLAGAVAGLLAGAYPAWRASRISPISALQR
ncbi:putative ABC transporter permease YknZ [Actinomadura rubteroloni]|uniref:Putative ABC transporter permease YknZ n=1 Tax=Actinomadura rubteroloni TaxID=1926885 RepID=A0A2P4UKB9_9ACTN|nr:ABC transporter permease [Actinomadura rubteroloni]POM25480.1 putative ABC transporter permease YknZ [Actinomadura rubteroloni]